MAENVDISGLDKVDLLEALWNNADPGCDLWILNSAHSAPSFSRDGKEMAAVKRYIDCFNGRCIKTDISGDSANPNHYDRDWGQGAFRSVVDEMRVRENCEEDDDENFIIGSRSIE